MNRQQAEHAIEQFLRAFGHEPEGELAQTPALVAEAWCDMLQGQGVDAAAILRESAMAADSGGLVVLRDLDVTTMCPHHLMPAHGRGDVLYLPGGQLAGFGAIARALRATTRKLTLQERAGEDMVSALMDGLGAKAAACRLRLTHTCLVARGAREGSALVESLTFSGTFADGEAERDIALAALR